MMMNQDQVEVKASQKFGARPYGDPWASRHGTTGEESDRRLFLSLVGSKGQL
jgi:hypothetical protein